MRYSWKYVSVEIIYDKEFVFFKGAVQDGITLRYLFDSFGQANLFYGRNNTSGTLTVYQSQEKSVTGPSSADVSAG